MRSTLLTALLVGAIALAASLAQNGTRLMQVRLFDTDDTMRLVQVLHWLDGAAWNDLTEPRMNPPLGVVLHWARLPDLPLAAVIGGLESVVGRDTATVAALILVPTTLLVAFLAAAGWASRPLTGRGAAPLGALVPALMGLPLTQFRPGRIDHHGWQLLLALMLVGMLVRLLLVRRARWPAVAAGLIPVPALWVGAEALPWIAAFHAALGLDWVLKGGRDRLDQGLAASAVLAVGAFALVPLVVPPARWTVGACDAFSVATAGLAAAPLLVWAGLRWAGAGAGAGSRPKRLGAAGALTAVALGLVLALFPECRQGVYGNVDPFIARFWLANVMETASLLDLVTSERPIRAVSLFTVPVLAFAVVLWRLWRGGPRARPVWQALALFLGLALGLAAWQVRMATFAQLFAVPVTAWLVATVWRQAERYRALPARVGLRLGSALLVTPFPWIALALPVTGRPPVPTEVACDLRPLAGALASAGTDRPLASAGTERPRLVASFIDLGPEILLRTRDAVLGAPYHRNGDGIRAAIELFRASNDDEAEAEVRRRGVDFVLMCRYAPEFRMYTGHDQAAEDGGITGDGAATFAGRLAAGRLPGWLEPVAVPNAPELMLYRVRRP